jgi:hypothetical protein
VHEQLIFSILPDRIIASHYSRADKTSILMLKNIKEEFLHFIAMEYKDNATIYYK